MSKLTGALAEPPSLRCGRGIGEYSNESAMRSKLRNEPASVVALRFRSNLLLSLYEPVLHLPARFCHVSVSVSVNGARAQRCGTPDLGRTLGA
jgi:hypothetical protein